MNLLYHLLCIAVYKIYLTRDAKQVLKHPCNLMFKLFFSYHLYLVARRAKPMTNLA